MRHEIIKQAIAQRAGMATGASTIAAAISDILRSLYAELDRLVGDQAASSLCAHAVHRTRSALHWTLPPTATINGTTLVLLRNDLAGRTPEDALIASETLLLALVDHLAALIGEGLTDRLLNTAWNLPGTGPTDQENL
jgi:hypothetical protein